MHAGRLARFDVAGQVLFNGSAVSAKQARGFVSFVEQDDAHHLPALSVRETVRYAASKEFRLSRTSERSSHVPLSSTPPADNDVQEVQDRKSRGGHTDSGAE